ncbi:hypothetical protein D9Q98_006544 [Chlorella vulgaris]|uniref:CG-1 domain-containing protein n=1 Tax=Chlorella vulgaris TaxID=3077 RepID=A0A9D4TKE0_CHLVU|nr:hypothetical protein D9Q98_006544 [Chlorella vulgaris]
MGIKTVGPVPPSSVAAVVEKARSSWLKNNEVLELLEGFETAGLSVCQEPPVQPPGGQLFLFDRRACRFFRRDGHTWCKKKDGKTIKETHEKLKVGTMETLNCYYAHADREDGLQRRCYWQLDPEKEHIVLVHYLCSSSSRAVPAGRGASGEVAADAATRPQRASRAQQRRAYSPSGECGGAPRRRGASQQRLSHHLASASSLETELMSGGDEHSELHLPLVPGISLEDAAALPPLFAMQQAAEAAAAAAAVQRQQHLLQFEGMLQSRGSNGSGSGSASASVGGDPFGLPPAGAHMHRSHPGVLYTDQRVATQLAQQSQLSAAAPLMPPPPIKQESFNTEQHKALFREMSLGIQREHVDEAAYFLGSPPGERDPLAGDKAAAGTPVADLAALLASPPHGGHRRTFSRQGSGLSRLISKNWESDVMEMMLPDVDADVTAYPVGPSGGVVQVEVAERVTSPRSRLFGNAGIAFFGSAQQDGAAVQQHALDPSPLAGPSLGPSQPEAAGSAGAGGGFDGGSGAASRHLPFSSPLALAHSGSSPLTPDSSGSLQFSAGEGQGIAQRPAAHTRVQRLSGGSGGGMPRTGSHPHLAHLAKRPAGPGGEATAEELEQRRKERLEAAANAAATAAQGHRYERLALARGQRTASSTEALDEALEMIDVPENMQRLSSFLPRAPTVVSGGRLTLGRELAAAEAAAVADLELETRSLLKGMSIDEVDAVAALREAAKELEVMPTIYAAASSDAEAASLGASQHLDSYSEDLVSSRNQSVSSLLEGVQVAAASYGAPGQAADPITEQLNAAMARHAAMRRAG